jgi:hypothetical protein
MRKHQDKFKEIDLTDKMSKDKMRSMPILSPDIFQELSINIPADIEAALTDENA